jgi:hypothetical protein
MKTFNMALNKKKQCQYDGSIFPTARKEGGGKKECR